MVYSVRVEKEIKTAYMTHYHLGFLYFQKPLLWVRPWQVVGSTRRKGLWGFMLSTPSLK